MIASLEPFPSSRNGRIGPSRALGEAAENDDSATSAAAAPPAAALPGPTQVTIGTFEARTASRSSSGSVSTAPWESIWRMTRVAPLVWARSIEFLISRATTGSIAPWTCTTSMCGSGAWAASLAPAAAAHDRATESKVTKAGSGRRTEDLYHWGDGAGRVVLLVPGDHPGGEGRRGQNDDRRRPVRGGRSGRSAGAARRAGRQVGAGL